VKKDYNSKYSVIIADDDAGCRETLKSILLERGFETYEASSGSETIHIVQQYHIDLGFLDYQMPDMTGLDILKIIRNINPILQCVIVTGVNEPTVADWARSLGALSLLHKPVRLDSIFETLDKMLNHLENLDIN